MIILRALGTPRSVPPRLSSEFPYSSGVVVILAYDRHLNSVGFLIDWVGRQVRNFSGSLPWACGPILSRLAISTHIKRILYFSQNHTLINR